MKIEFRIPISPNPAFYSQLRLFTLSLARLGPRYRTAKIVVSVGDAAQLDVVVRQNEWARDFPVEWSIVPPEVCQQLTTKASGWWRYATPSDADVIILCDADTCVVGPFNGLLAQMGRTASAVAGLQAHYTPFKGVDKDANWRNVLTEIGEKDFPLFHGYSMDVHHSGGWAPPYFNYGFVAFNPFAFARIASVMMNNLMVSSTLFPKTPFVAQIALALSMIQEKVFPIMLGHEYNCANDDVLIDHGLVDVNCIRVIHYLRNDEFDRHDFLCDKEKFQDFMEVPKNNVITGMLQRHLTKIPDVFIDWT